jgi:hypothetical protein
MKISKIQTFGWQNAIRGMRYSFDSEDKADSLYFYKDDGDGLVMNPMLGINDLDLMLKLIKGGSSHRKVLRAIHIQMSVIGTMTWWKHFDTYKVATTALSRSTMHTMMRKKLTINDFGSYNQSQALIDVVDYINSLIDKFNQIKNIPNSSKEELEQLFFEVLDILPMSYMQERMVDLNYETLLNILYQRSNHKLKHEWSQFCKICLLEIPYLEDFYNAAKK